MSGRQPQAGVVLNGPLGLAITALALLGVTNPGACRTAKLTRSSARLCWPGLRVRVSGGKVTLTFSQTRGLGARIADALDGYRFNEYPRRKLGDIPVESDWCWAGKHQEELRRVLVLGPWPE